MAHRFEPDLVLLDLHMPHLDGYAVLRSLSSMIHAPVPLPVLVLTADITPEARQRALELGASDFLGKPFNLGELVMRISNLVDTRLRQLDLSRQVTSMRSNLDAEGGEAADRRQLHRRIEQTIERRAITIVYQPLVTHRLGRRGRLRGAGPLPDPTDRAARRLVPQRTRGRPRSAPRAGRRSNWHSASCPRSSPTPSSR